MGGRMSNGETLIRGLQEVSAEVSALLSRLDDPRRSRPSNSQERRRLADQAERATTALDVICHDLGAWIGEQPIGQHQPERAETPEAACADVARAREVLDRDRTELQRCVEAARSHGATWRQIGEALDITAQTAHKRFDPRARRRHADYMRKRNQRQGV